MQRHPLHLAIGRLLCSRLSKYGSDLRVVCAPECGGNQNIPLFFSDEVSNSSELANVDMLIAGKTHALVIIEIEEANVSPLQICGKVLTSSLCSWHLHKNGAVSLFDSNSILFVQVVDTCKLKKLSSKRAQWRNLEKCISAALPFGGSKIDKYALLFMNVDDVVKQTDNARQIVLKIEDHLNQHH